MTHGAHRDGGIFKSDIDDSIQLFSIQSLTEPSGECTTHANAIETNHGNPQLISGNSSLIALGMTRYEDEIVTIAILLEYFGSPIFNLNGRRRTSIKESNEIGFHIADQV